MRCAAPALLLACVLLAAPGDAAATWISIDGNRSPPNPVWPSLPVHWSMNQNGSADIGTAASETACLDSFAAWAEPGCTSWATAYDGTTPSMPGGSGHVIGWVESGWPYGGGAIGICMVSFSGASTISSATIAFNGVHYTWNTTGGGGSAVDTQSIATHEMGHFLGLGDLYSCSGETMCGIYSGGTGARSLHADDITGVCTLYPSGAADCTTDDDCPPGERCEGGFCVPFTPAGEPCDPCTTHEDCGSTYDLCMSGFPDGESYCGAECTSAGDCPSGFDCVDVGAPVNQCVPSDGDCAGTSPDCTTDDDCPPGEHCEDGTCVPDTPPECTTDDDCPPGEVCRDGECIPDTSPHLPRCSECTTHEECGGTDDLCMSGFVDGTMRCGISCDSVDGNCGSGNTCYHFDDLPDQCIPEDMDCTPDCSTDEDCPPGHHCVDGYCTNVCDPSAMFSCPDGWYCRFITCETGVCEPAPDEPGPLSVGERCTSDFDCNTLRCQRLIDGTFCASACNFLGGGVCPLSTASDPPISTSCQPLERGLCGYCSCSGGMLGDACSTSGQCQDSTCVVVGGTGVCTIECAETGTGCPGGFTCQPVGDGSTSACVPDLAAMGQPCATDEECAGGVCVVSGESSFCSRRCGLTGCTCPMGYTCSEVSVGVNACVVSSIVMVSGCGCSLPGSGGKDGWPIAIILVILGCYALVVAKRKFFS